jgi:hypothetical protein
MSYLNRDFPHFSENARYGLPALQAPGYRRLDSDGIEEVYTGNLNYLEFVSLVKKIWEESYPTIPILPLSINRESSVTYSDSGGIENSTRDLSSAPSSTSVGLDDFPAIIGYHLELRKSHTTEPKPRMRQNVLSNSVTIYGQKFQNVVGFTVMSKVGTFQGANSTTTRDDLDAAVLCDQVMEAFEDFMLEYTSIFKAAGASELVYSRRLSDSEINRDGKDIHKRTVTYMLTTEKTFAIANNRIEKIVVDARTWMAYEKELLKEMHCATPNYSGTEGNVIDLFQGATPNS